MDLMKAWLEQNAGKRRKFKKQKAKNILHSLLEVEYIVSLWRL